MEWVYKITAIDRNQKEPVTIEYEHDIQRAEYLQILYSRVGYIVTLEPMRATDVVSR